MKKNLNIKHKFYKVVLSLVFVCFLAGCNDTTQTQNSSNSETSIEDKITNTSTEIIYEDDPYINIDKDEFYASYSPATSYVDAFLRSKHHLMSGDIEVPDEAPTIDEARPRHEEKLIHSNKIDYLDDGNTYTVYDSKYNVKKYIYKAGAYITLEDVAAYVYAFGTVPCNYDLSCTVPDISPWGIYLRINYREFMGNTKRFPYQPDLPSIYGIKDGHLKYKEIDIGTTGTSCDPRYPIKPYNDGIHITRGAARIVFSEYNSKTNKPIEDLNERYVFYTYNHYNDFQEYLNYYNGWGDMFGNISGGGKLSSKTDFNPTSYIETIRGQLI